MPTTLAIIPARGGSKGVPRKNVRAVGGKPLIAWTIDAALEARSRLRVVVSTEDDEIARVTEGLGAEVPFRRPMELATDEVRIEPVVMHALDWLREREAWQPDNVLLLQPTSPLRTSQDIDEALTLLDTSGADSVIGVTPARPHPAWMKTIDENGRLRPLLDGTIPPRRQDLPPVYAVNGAIYLVRTSVFRNVQSFYGDVVVPFVMPPERSSDVDTPLDLCVVDLLLRNGRRPDRDGA